MVTVEKAVVARLDKSGKHFEVLVDPEIAYDLKSGKVVSIARMLATNQVFTDAKKGDRANTSDLQKLFGTTEVEKITDIIVKEGDVQLTTELRRKKIDEKKKQIATFISKYAIDPRTKLPHPQDRILNVMEQSKLNIDPFKQAEQQVEDVISAIKQILPLSVEEVTIIVEVPMQFGSKVKGILKEYGTGNDQWLGDKYVVKIKIPAGMKEKFFRTVNQIAAGQARITEEK